MKNSLKTIGQYRLVITNPDGSQQDTGWLNNLVTNVGKAAIAGLMGNVGAITAFSYIALGSSATAPTLTDTTLTAEYVSGGLSRSASTVTRITTSVTNDTLQFTNTFTSSASNTIQEIGILNAASSGILAGHGLTGAIAVVNGSVIVAFYTVQFT